jgi:alkylation response protein AidB-like acyl-CoA dehydrogenase
MSDETRIEALRIADKLAHEFAETAAERDAQGGTPKLQRDRLRESGLLAMWIPETLGGWGCDWPTTFEAVRRIARVDGSVGHVFGFQHLLLATTQLFARPEQWRPWLAETARQRWFWGNALNPLDTRTSVAWSGDTGRIDGDKSFCSGALDSDMLIVSAIDPNDPRLMIAALPTSRAGILLREDWDNMGQRQTDSGSARFEDVRVERHEVLATPGPLGSTFASLRPCVAQLVLCNIYVGIAQGAFDVAREHTRHSGRPWFTSGVEHASDDPYVLRHFGELYTELEAARLLTDLAAQELERAWQLGEALTRVQRGAAAVAIAVAKAKTTTVSLETTSRIFEVMGARATTAKARYDRFWRNARTHTLHDPVDYKLRDIGSWALTDKPPKPTFYS